VSKALRDADIEAEVVLEADNPGVAKRAVQSGLGVAFLSRFTIRTALQANILRAVRVPGLDIRRELTIIHRKDKHLSRAARAFIESASLA